MIIDFREGVDYLARVVEKKEIVNIKAISSKGGIR